jgi:hypothetical protein
LLIPSALALNAKITSVSFNSDELIAHHNYSVFIVITNQSTVPIDTNLNLYDGNILFFAFRYGIDSSADLNIAIPYTPSIDGSRNFTASIDLVDDIPSDNNLSKPIIVYRGQDPAIANVYLSGYQLPNTTARPQIYITNNGDKYTGFFDLTFTFDSTVLNTILINPMYPNESRQIDYNFQTPASGSHTFTVQIDKNHVLNEFSTLNNFGQATFIISTTTDGNLSRDDIYRLIDQYFKERVDETKTSLTICQAAVQAQLTQLNSCIIQKDNAIALSQTNMDTLTTVQAAKQTCETNLSTSLTTAQTAYNVNLQAANDLWENKENTMKLNYEYLLQLADQNVQSANQLAKEKESMNTVMAVIFFLVMAFIAYWIYQTKRLPLKT